MIVGAIISCSTVVLSGSDPGATRARYLMGTLCEARAYGDAAIAGAALDAALDRIAELEQVMTTYREGGELARLNAAFASSAPGTPVGISHELLVALEDAFDWARRTSGRFDPTIGSVKSAWNLDGPGRRPAEAELAEALRRTSWRLVDLDRASSSATCRHPGVSIDLGGFGKGHALDAAAAVLRAEGIASALINFGGQVLALGAPPGEPGWIVEIADPSDRDRSVLALRVRDASVATSGNAERAVVIDGRSYGHILDPSTGLPVELSGSVTVVASEAAAADVLATALAVAGPLEGPTLMPEGVEFLFLSPSHRAISATATPSLRARVLESRNIEWSAEPGASNRRVARP